MRKGFIALYTATAFAGILAVCVSQASAGWFSRQHPRRAEIDRREEHQQERIRRGLRNGSLSPAEAQDLENQERAIRRQEHEEVRANGGSVTKHQAQQLNHEEDMLNREIHHDNHN